MRRTNTVLFFLAAPWLVALVACGGPAAPASPPPAVPPDEVLARAPERTAAAGPFRVGYRLSSAGGAVEAEGLFDPATGRGRLSFDLSSLGSPAEGGAGGRW